MSPAWVRGGTQIGDGLNCSRWLRVYNIYVTTIAAKTNYSHPRCYARSLNDCSNKISGEHFISASVLKLLGDEHVLSNITWIPEGETSAPLSVEALQSNILCQRHNSQLSDLDNCAHLFFRGWVEAVSSPPLYTGLRQVKISGDLFEKWMLKLLFGIVASGWIRNGGIPLETEAASRLLRILFAGEGWSRGTGLYFSKAPLTPSLQLGAGPLVDENDRRVGGGFEFAGLDLAIMTDETGRLPLLPDAGGQYFDYIYRPGMIRVEDGQRTTEFIFEWEKWQPVANLLVQRQA